MKILVTGGRNYRDASVVDRYLTQLNPSMIIEGGCTGWDRLCRQWGRAHGVHVATIDALWDFYGNAAVRCT